MSVPISVCKFTGNVGDQSCASFFMCHHISRDQTVLDGLDLDENTKKVLLTNITQRLMPQAVKCRADVQVACFTHEGIDAVKEALMKGLENENEDMPIKVWQGGTTESKFL